MDRAWYGRFLAVAALILITRPLAAEDFVYLKNGQRLRGSVRSETPVEIVVTASDGSTHRLSVDQVDRIQYDGPTGAAVSQAWFKERAGNYEDAVAGYERALAQASPGSPVRIAAEFARARTLAKWAAVDPAKTEDAERALRQFLQKHRDSRHYYPALQWLYRVQILAGKVEEARGVLRELSQSPLPAFRAEAALAEAELALKAGEPASAKETLQRLMDQEDLPEEVKWRAQLLQAELTAAEGNLDEALKQVRSLIDAIPAENDTLNARAFLTLGRIYERADKPMDAILAYLYVDLMYPDLAEYRAEALAKLAQLWGKAGRPDRARQARELLLQEYPNSQWARQLSAAPEAE